MGSSFCFSEQGMKFVYILVGFTGECLNRQTAAGLPSQQLINNSAPLSLFLRVFVCVRARPRNCEQKKERADDCAQRKT